MHTMTIHDYASLNPAERQHAIAFYDSFRIESFYRRGLIGRPTYVVTLDLGEGGAYLYMRADTLLAIRTDSIHAGEG
ncbi:MAG: hypothetical protein SGJ24_04565 [Chloroflexota bacterium]|nr:hypothetical protein [Chloroflexota bacterium]